MKKNNRKRKRAKIDYNSSRNRKRTRVQYNASMMSDNREENKLNNVEERKSSSSKAHEWSLFLFLNLIYQSIAVKNKWNHACMQKEMMRLCMYICKRWNVNRIELPVQLLFFLLVIVCSLEQYDQLASFRDVRIYSFFSHTIILYVYINIYIFCFILI